MKRVAMLASVLALVIGVAGMAWAHLPEATTYYAWGFAAGQEPTADGNIADWAGIQATDAATWNAVAVTTEEYYEVLVGLGIGGAGVDLSTFAVTAAMGWSDATDRFYMMAEWFDNIHQIDRENPAQIWSDDVWEFGIDATHSGGTYDPPEGGWADEATQKDLQGSRHQQYKLAVPPFPNVFVEEKNASTWLIGDGLPPKAYWDAGWTYTGDQFGESTYTIEMMLTPWEFLDYRGPDNSQIKDLAAGEIVGVSWCFGDFDEEPLDYAGFWSLTGANPNLGIQLADFYLLPTTEIKGGPAAVESKTWGRIKSQFVE